MIRNKNDISDGIERNYIECQCTSPGHLLRFMWFHRTKEYDGPEWDEVFVNSHLDHKFGFFKRIYYGLKYIFGFRSSYGHFDETILGRSEMIQLKDLCNRWLKAHPEIKND